MNKADVLESVPLVRDATDWLMLAISKRGREGSVCRTAIGALLVNAQYYLFNDIMGAPLDEVFELARQAGAGVDILEQLRRDLAARETKSLGATLTRDSIVQLTLATQARVILDLVFTSRQSAEAMIQSVNSAFVPAEDLMADAMDAATYRRLIELHAAVTRYLTRTAQPLPQVIKFRFAKPLSTLRASYRLYADAGRGDELREANRVVHPAFMRPTGQALAS